MKVVINTKFGGFGLSQKACLRLIELGYEGLEPIEEEDWDIEYYGNSFTGTRDIERNNPLLVQVVEELKEEANSKHARLEIVEIPDNVEWHIDEYDGNEQVAENHRTWR